MSSLRPPPGAQLGSGRIRVDAARAIAKLREYQLADRSAWVLEVVRAGVAAGATAIEVAGDADDVWVAWRGAQIAAAELPHLFDELVSPEAAADRQHVRLLAAGINSALGTRPWFADVYAVPGGRVRFTPESLAEEGLRALAVEPVTPPAGAPVGGDVVIHLRRRLSLAVAARFFTREEPRELTLVREACRDLPVPLTLAGVRHEPARGGDANLGSDIVRVPLGDGLDGWLAVVDPGAPRHREAGRTGVLELAERGVVVERIALVLSAPPSAPLPIRAFVDAPRLPTDASRSHVRAELHPVTTARQRALEVLPALVAALLAEAERDDDRGDRARTAAIALFAGVRGGSFPEMAAAPPPFDALGLAPILRDAAGTHHPAIGHRWTSIIVARAAPVAAELAPFASDVLWMNDRALAIWLAGSRVYVDDATAGRRVRAAKQRAKRHREFFAHAAKAPAAIARRPPRARALFGGDRHRDDRTWASAVDDATAFANVTGEVCIYTELHSLGDMSELVLLWHGRELERVEMASAIPFDAVIDSAALAPGERYRSAVRDAAFAAAVTAVRAALVRAVEIVAHEAAARERPLGEPGDDDERAHDDRVEPGGMTTGDAALIRRALVLVGELGLPAIGPLVDARAWPCTDGSARAAVELRAQPVIGTAPSWAHRVQPAGRPVACIGIPDDASLLARLCPDSQIVTYAADLRPATLASLVGAFPTCALVVFDGTSATAQLGSDAPPGTLAVIAPGPPRRVLSHCGVRVVDEPYTHAYLPCTIAIDCDAIVPSPGTTWMSLRDDAHQREHPFGTWELALVRALWFALAGERPANLLGDAVDFGSPLADLACGVLAQHPGPLALPAALVAKLRTIPFVTVLGDPVPCSLAELAAAGRFTGGKLWYAAADVAPVPGAFAIAAPLLRARALARLAGVEAHDATADLADRRAAAHRETALANLRARPRRDAVLPGAPVTVAIAAPFARGQVALGADQTTLTVLCEGRDICHIVEAGWPLDAIVDVAAHALDDNLAQLQRTALDAIRFAVADAAPDLLVAIAERAPELLATRALDLVSGWTAGSGALDARVRGALFAATAWPTIQNRLVSLADAQTEEHQVRVATLDGDWLAPEDGEPPSPLDRPILRTGTRRLHIAIARLAGGDLGDVTAAAKELQRARRMARGLAPRPRLTHLPAAHRCELRALGSLGLALGLGEIGFAGDAAPRGTAHVFREDVVERTVPIDVSPRVDVAIDADALARLMAGGTSAAAAIERAVQPIAALAFWKLLPALVPLSSAVRRAVFSAVVRGVLAPAELAARDLAIAELASGEVVPFAAVQEQLARFGNVWCVTDAAASARTLDPARRVFRATGEDCARTFGLVDAAAELALDARALANLALPKRASAASAIDVPTLALEDLGGDGVTAARIVVGLVDPADAAVARAWPMRGGRPFQPEEIAGCPWPTVAAIDDARFVPDRTWDHPLHDETWERALARVREAGERMHAALGGDAPADAIASVRVDKALLARGISAAGSPGFAMAGVLWLDREPAATRPLEVVVGRGSGSHAYTGAVRARLYPHGVTGSVLATTLDEICAMAHGALLRRLIARGIHPADDAALAHLAVGLAQFRIDFTALGLVAFPCFAPNPLTAGQLQALLRATDRVPVIGADEDRRRTRGLVDDGSQLARVILALIGARAWVAPANLPKVPPPTAPRPETLSLAQTLEAMSPRPVTAPVPALPGLPPPARARPVPPPPPAHPLEPLARDLSRRLGELGIQLPAVAIALDPAAPLLSCAASIILGAADPRAHQIHLLATTDPARYAAALDALAAHATTLLNRAYDAVTDATELAALARLAQRS